MNKHRGIESERAFICLALFSLILSSHTHLYTDIIPPWNILGFSCCRLFQYDLANCSCYVWRTESPDVLTNKQAGNISLSAERYMLLSCFWYPGWNIEHCTPYSMIGVSVT